MLKLKSLLTEAPEDELATVFGKSEKGGSVAKGQEQLAKIIGDSNGNLNYFVARSFYNSPLKYKNPPAPKDTVIFDLYINWNMPVVLCEGVFDAMAIKRNAVPLLGKTVQETLLKKLINSTKEVIVCLDSDAQDTIYKVTEKLLRHGIKVSRVNLTEGDPSDLGFSVMSYALQKSIPVNEYDLIKQKIMKKHKINKQIY